jgi:hypothetical protein
VGTSNGLRLKSSVFRANDEVSMMKTFLKLGNETLLCLDDIQYVGSLIPHTELKLRNSYEIILTSGRSLILSNEPIKMSYSDAVNNGIDWFDYDEFIRIFKSHFKIINREEQKHEIHTPTYSD